MTITSLQERENLNKKIGERIRYFRNSACLSQAALGKALEVTFQQMQKYETGRNRISAAGLVIIARTVERNIIDFYDPLPAVQTEVDCKHNELAKLMQVLEKKDAKLFVAIKYMIMVAVDTPTIE